MISSMALQALADAGATPEMLIAVVKQTEREDLEKTLERRAAWRKAKRYQRSCPKDIEGQSRTPKDGPSPSLPLPPSLLLPLSHSP